MPIGQGRGAVEREQRCEVGYRTIEILQCTVGHSTLQEQGTQLCIVGIGSYSLRQRLGKNKEIYRVAIV